MAKQNKCESCGWYLSPDKCQLLKIIINPEEDYCSKHRDKIPTCDICGSLINKNGIFDPNFGKPHLICENCRKLLYTCHLCNNAARCDFETNSSPLPKVVQRKIQQGPYQVVTDVRNPDRIEITCKNGCPCFHPEIGCSKEKFKTCKNNTFNY